MKRTIIKLFINLDVNQDVINLLNSNPRMTAIQESIVTVPDENSILEKSQEVEVNINELLENHAKFNEHDTILSPIDKFDEEVPFESNNDSVSTATDRSGGSHTPQKPKRKVFDFDVDKVF